MTDYFAIITWTLYFVVRYLLLLLPFVLIFVIIVIRHLLSRAYGIEVIDVNNFALHKFEFANKFFLAIRKEAYDLGNYVIPNIEITIAKIFTYRVPLVFFYRYLPNPILHDIQHIVEFKKYRQELYEFVEYLQLKYQENPRIMREVIKCKKKLKRQKKRRK